MNSEILTGSAQNASAGPANVKTEQPRELLATHEEMDAFCVSHSEAIIPRFLTQPEVPAILRRLERLANIARREGLPRLEKGFRTSRRMIIAGKRRQTRRGAVVTITRED